QSLQALLLHHLREPQRGRRVSRAARWWVTRPGTPDFESLKLLHISADRDNLSYSKEVSPSSARFRHSSAGIAIAAYSAFCFSCAGRLPPTTTERTTKDCSGNWMAAAGSGTP